VPAPLSIGDFSRATHLSIKTLRHYHDRALLVPSAVDAGSGYRRYAIEQIPAAQVIRRFRDLDMPLEQIRAVLDAPDVRARNQLIAAHLTRLERDLAQTQSAVASLRDLLAGPAQAAPIHQRRAPSALTAAVTSVIRAEEILPWFRGALGELQATLRASRISPAGPAGGSYTTELFSHDQGEATVFIPVATEIKPVGRVTPQVMPAAELAVIEHPGPHDDVDRSYGALAAYVAEHALSVDGPIREYYLVGWLDTEDESAWRTEIGWPIFSTLS
jgi:DNA-binding transcriptional MerR regulator